MKPLDVKTITYSSVGESEEQRINDSLKKIELIDGVVADKISGRIVMTRIEEGLLISGKLEAELFLICDRCLTDFKTKRQIVIDRIYSFKSAEKNEDWLEIGKDDKINLTEPVREEIILKTSLKNLCKSDCLGICPECGENKNSGRCRCK